MVNFYFDNMNTYCIQAKGFLFYDIWIHPWQIDYKYEDFPYGDIMNLSSKYCIGWFWLWNSEDLVKDYWLCKIQGNSLSKASSSLQSNETYFESKATWNHSESNAPYANNPNRGSFPTISRNFMGILKWLENGNEVIFRHWYKSARGLYHGVSRRRSRYIGVLKNGRRWQVLINEGRTKKYIGTYSSEVEAAIVYDFYSIGLNGFSAKTNFNYKSDQVRSMIISYFNNNQEFDPSIFSSQIN